MIEFNLLPDVKLQYIKARRTKHTVMLVAGSVAGVSIAILILLFVAVNVLQKHHLNNLNKDIQKYSQELQNTEDLDKILTIQNQLNSLPDLHSKKVVASRLFGYLGQLTPAQVSISSFDIDFNKYTMSFTGAADSLSTVNKFTDTLKFTTYSAGDKKDANAFSNVVLASFSKGDKNSTYQITVNYDPIIFDSTNDVTLTVPKIISTRSETEKPSALFQEQGTNP